MLDAKVQNPSFRTLTFSGKNDTGCLSQSHETPFISRVISYLQTVQQKVQKLTRCKGRMTLHPGKDLTHEVHILCISASNGLLFGFNRQPLYLLLFENTDSHCVWLTLARQLYFSMSPFTREYQAYLNNMHAIRQKLTSELSYFFLSWWFLYFFKKWKQAWHSAHTFHVVFSFDSFTSSHWG